MKYIVDKDSIYIGFGGSNTKLVDGQKEVPFAPNEDFVKAKWDNIQWVEGATEEEIAEYQKSLVPQVITRRQFKIALAVLGKNEQDILNGINQLPEPTRTITTISYTEAGTFERENPELIFVGKTFLQMTDEQIDEVFIIGNEY
jgi:hypothetical protein